MTATIQRPTCPHCRKEMTWFGHEADYICYTHGCEHEGMTAREIWAYVPPCKRIEGGADSR